MHYAKLNWQVTGEPLSVEYGDVYFSRQNGLLESEYVFLAGNDLKTRFQNLADNAHFIIGETGFGTGLNFLETLKLWLQYAPKTARLSYVSCEKYPLKYVDLAQALSIWTDVTNEVVLLLAIYPHSFYSGQTLLSITENIQLILLIDDAASSLAKIDIAVDAWFLDGFAPSKNPHMWSELLFKEIYRLSQANTTLATFSSAGIVKRALEAQGFVVKKQKGFGIKREMITASIQDESKQIIRKLKPYFSKPMSAVDKAKPIAVIGAGMAGCALAYELSQCGYKVHLYDQCDDIAQQASGNPYGILHPYITADANISDLFHSQGFLYTREYILKHHQEVDFVECGALELLTDEKRQQRFANILKKRVLDDSLLQVVSASEASKISGCDINATCAYYPQAMMVNPYSLCISLVKKNIDINLFLRHQLIDCTKDADDGWQLSFADGKRLHYEQVIFAGNAGLMQQLKVLNNLEVYSSYGQITITKKMLNNRTMILDKGYILPSINNQQLIGASFRDNDDLTADLRAEDDHMNLEQLAHIIDATKCSQPIASRVALRCVSSDHMPMIGALVDENIFYQQYFQSLQKGTITKLLPQVQHLEGLYVLTGFGSKGLCSMLYGAKILSRLIKESGNAPIANHLLEALHPLRFSVRKYKQK